MTEPAPEPTLEQQIVAASREVIAAKLARPRDPQRIDDAMAALAALRAQADA